MSATLRSLFLICRDLAASAAFYQRLGFETRKSTARSHVLSLGHSDVELHLHASLTAQEEADYGVAYQPGGSGLVLSFGVDDLDSMLESAPPESLLVAPRLTPWGQRLAILTDPDGYRLEFQDGRHER